MKSFCIKTNNQQIINYLLKRLSSITLEQVYYIHRKFKIYDNVIIHYTGDQKFTFCNIVSDILSDTILLFFEPVLLDKILAFNYFYFDDFERKLIEKNCYDFILSNENEKLHYRKEEICTSLLNYIIENKSMILDGFVTFRLPEYLNTLDYIVDESVNQYIIEKEYKEFINLLKMYIDSKESQTDIVHLIYTNGESILLDSQKNVISLNDYMFNAQYLSDISFSSNDYALNTLLTLLPRKIEIHLISYEDEFINTLKLIFGTKIFICTDCNICRTYKVLNNVR